MHAVKHILGSGLLLVRRADVTVNDFSASLDMRRYKKWVHKISWKYLAIRRPVLLVFPTAQSASFLIATLNPLQGVLKVSSRSSSRFNPCRSSWQVPVCSGIWQNVKDLIGFIEQFMNWAAPHLATK